MKKSFDKNRRKFLIEAGMSVPALSFPGLVLGATPDDPIATCAQGKLRGSYQNGISVFKGIPYGGQVSGAANRFRSPPPPQGWLGVRDATMFGAPAIQRAIPFGFQHPDPSEDCLFLNVWTPALDGAKRPVMVYQHGGGFVIGSGGAPWQDGSALAREHDVVVVQSNHRLGLMGYLYLGELLGDEYRGNQGLEDLVAALKWVNENIAEFGGDPNNVMIFGESGGGGKTSALYAMPSAAPFFNKASIESPIGPGAATPEQATEVTREVMRRLDVKDPRKLLSMPADILLQAQLGDGLNLAPGEVGDSGREAQNREIMFWPFVDGSILPEEPFREAAPLVSAAKPLMVGTCKDETVFFYRGVKSVFNLSDEQLQQRLEPILGERTSAWIDVFRKSRPEATPSELFIAITTAKPWRAHATRIAEMKAREETAQVYNYILDYNSPDVVEGTDFPQGSPHASDIAMKFNTAPQFGPGHPERLQTARNMSSMWASFARDGNPTIVGQAEWKPYTLESRQTMIIDANCRMVNDPEREERLFWSGEEGADIESRNR